MWSNLIKEGYSFTQDKRKMNIDIIHKFLSQDSTWALGISREIVEKSMGNSLCFAILFYGSLVAFARVITDKSTFANLVDVFVLPGHRGKGLSLWLNQEILLHPDLQRLRRFILVTSTAKPLYAKFGFKGLLKPETFMEKYVPDVYSFT